MNFLALAFILASLHIPQTNDKTLQQEPLKLGEVAFVGSDDGANVKVGSGSFLPYDVYDKSALRGYSLSKLGRGDYIVNCSSNLTYNKAQNKWTATGITSNSVYQIWFTCKNDVVLNSLEIESSVNVGEMIPSSSFEMEYEVSGNIITATLTYPENALSGVIDNPEIEVRNFGDPNHVTDLKNCHFAMKDTLGEFDLSNLRSSLINYHNGNRGEDWSDFKAKRSVMIENNRLTMGTNRSHGKLFDFGISASSTNVVVKRVMGFEAEKFYMSEGEQYTNGESISISSLVVSGNAVQLTLSISNFASFDTSKLNIFGVDVLAEGSAWERQSFSVVSSSASSVVVSMPKTKYTNFRAYYTASKPVVEVCGKLRMRGEDGVLYELRINAGTITATAIAE